MGQYSPGHVTIDGNPTMSNLSSETIAQIRALQRQASSLLIYQSVLQGEIAQAFLNLLAFLRQPEDHNFAGLAAYGHFFQLQASSNLSWPDFLIAEILRADNPFSQQIQQQNLAELPDALIQAVKQDLQILQTLFRCSNQQLSHWVKTAYNLPKLPIFWPDNAHQSTDHAALVKMANWENAIDLLSHHYHQSGTGLFSQYRAFRWQNPDGLVGISHPDPIQLQDLAGYEWQRQALLQNTEFLLAGLPALHVLLYGSRGSGKSSLVKALLNQYASQQLRLIEVSKTALADLGIIVEKLRNLPQKFIIFVDDLSFEEDDDAFKSLKVVLEGSITARPLNVIVYATSNRRHLVREFFEDRPTPKDADEVHAWDTLQEKLSFSDRFGLTLTFEPANQDTYLEIVRHLATQAKINLDVADLDFKAKEWATRHNGRSGRTARQFINFLQAEILLKK